MNLAEKLALLAEAAKYDVSCASSGSRRGHRVRSFGNATPSGICHTYTEDGRCVSLLKVLYTNRCMYRCAYCVNRLDNDIPRASFTPREIVSLTSDFYRRNYIEGLFLSSGVVRSPDDTMERLVHTVALLRSEGFNGYIHLKCVPFASRRLVLAAGRYADRLSVNIELPSEHSLQQLTGTKTYASVLHPMGVIRDGIAEAREDRKRLRHTPSFAPAGQSTQLIVGASPESDLEILQLSDRLYGQNELKRVYYSAYIPVSDGAGCSKPIDTPVLTRENRLYQADWLIRLYGFTVEELVHEDTPWLDLTMDPKHAFAHRHPELFPVDLNTADREMILKVPGIGLKSANRIVNLRTKGRLRLEHIRQLGAIVSRARPFIHCDGLPLEQWPGKCPTPAPKSPRPDADKKVRHTGADRLIYEIDNSFENLLCAIFEGHQTGRHPDAIESSVKGQLGMFEKRQTIKSDQVIANRVWKGLKTHMGSRNRQKVLHAYLSGHPNVENLIYQRVVDAITQRRNPTLRVRLAAILQIDKLSQKVRREAHRMKGFVRFEQTRDGRFVALIGPRYDVLPLIRGHFETRFADQQWIIYDIHRGYGIGYANHKAQTVHLETEQDITGIRDKDYREELCQSLWRCYYSAATIDRRKNAKLHQSRLPKRYWKYLTEKRF